MRKLISVLLAGAFAAAFSLGAAAAGPGGHSAAAPGGPPARSQAQENSNGRFAADRDKGLDRAEDRMSDQGRKHQKATAAQKRQKPDLENSSAGATK